MAERVRVREINDDEGRRLLRIIRRGIESVVTWRRAQMDLLYAQGMPVTKIAEVTFASDDRVRDVLHNFNDDGFDSLYPKHEEGTGQHDPLLHHLAKPPCRRPAPTRRRRQAHVA